MNAAPAPTVASRMATSHPSTGFGQAALWQEFIELVLRVLREAEAELRKPETWSRFAERDGWWLRAPRKTTSGTKVSLPSEDAITDALVELAEAIRLGAADADPLKTQQITFDGQVVRPAHRRIGSKALTTDIRIRSLALPALEIRVEAKLLFRPKDLAVAYCGEKGLLRFADPAHPYTDRPLGFMLGYSLQDHDPSWRARVIELLRSVGQVAGVGEVAAGGAIHPISDLSWGADERQKVSVIHLFMNFDTDPPCRPTRLGASDTAKPDKPSAR